MRHCYLVLCVVLAAHAHAQTPCWSSHAAGTAHSVAVTGDGRIASWGNNQEGQLGDGTNDSIAVPVVTVTSAGWHNVFASAVSTFAIRTDGSLWGWGYNDFGKLGIGGTQDQNAPVQIGADTDWHTVDGGPYQTYGIKDNGTLWGWGRNNGNPYMLGNGGTTNAEQPVQIGSSTDWVQVSNGERHSLGVRTDGSLWGWGWGQGGALGDGAGAAYDTPTLIGTDLWTSVDCGMAHSIGIKSDGTLWLTGVTVFSPTTLTDGWERMGEEDDWAVVVGAMGASYALKNNGTLWAMGMVLGVFHDTPVQIGSDADWATISCAGHHLTAQKMDGTLWTWGNNEFGQLGDGTTVTRPLPQEVLCTDLTTGIATAPKRTVAAHVGEHGSLLHVQAPGSLRNATFSIHDQTARMAMNGHYTGDVVPIQHLASGTYTFVLSSGQEMYHARFVKP